MPAVSRSQRRFRTCAAIASAASSSGARDPVLLDDEPAVVAARGELGEERVQVDVARAELAEHAAAPRLAPSRARRRSRALEHRARASFTCTWSIAAGPVAQRLDRVAAAESRWPVSRRRPTSGELEQALDLAGASTYVRVWWWNVGSKPRARATSAARATPSARRAQPASSRPTLRSVAAAPGFAPRGAGSRRRRTRAAPRARRRPRRGRGCRSMAPMSSPDRSGSLKRIGQQPPTSSSPASSSRPRSTSPLAEVAGRAELGPLVAGAGDRGEHAPVGAGHVRQPPTVSSNAP